MAIDKGSAIPTFGSRVHGCPYVVRPSAYAIVTRGANELAVVRTDAGCYLPGGGVEAGEDFKRAIEREAVEECGLVLRVHEPLTSAIEIVYSEKEGACFEKQSTFAEANVIDLVTPTDPTHELGWLSMDEASRTLTYGSHRWALTCLINKTTCRPSADTEPPAALSHIGNLVEVMIDRPLGSGHPRHGFQYPVNYGHIGGTLSADGEELDAYVLGVPNPRLRFKGRCIAVIIRDDDDDPKLVVVPDGTYFSDHQIREATDFQEARFKSRVVRVPHE
jgi:inorganic pyrophosphatase